MEIDKRWNQLWTTAQVFERTWSLCIRCCDVIWWPVCTFWILGQDSSFVGSWSVSICLGFNLIILYSRSGSFHCDCWKIGIFYFWENMIFLVKISLNLVRADMVVSWKMITKCTASSYIFALLHAQNVTVHWYQQV